MAADPAPWAAPTVATAPPRDRALRSSCAPYRSQGELVPSWSCERAENAICLRERTSRVTSTGQPGRNHAGRPRQRLVRGEGAWLGLAHAHASEPDPAAAGAAQQRLIVRRHEADDAPPLDGE